jgi:predicted nucleic acid-binding protein
MLPKSAPPNGGRDGGAHRHQPLDRFHPEAIVREMKQFIAPYSLDPDAVPADPVVFEVLRHAGPDEIPPVLAQFQMMPLLATPDNLWTNAEKLGQRCRAKGIVTGSLDLLIVAIAIHHDAQLITFDRDFEMITDVCQLRVTILDRR